MRSLMEADSEIKSDRKTTEKQESDPINKLNLSSDTKAPERNPKVPWKFGRRRSLSPMSRVQGMLEDHHKDDI